MINKEEKKLVLFLVMFILLIGFANAVCTVEFDEDDYSPLATVTASMTCSSPLEKSDPYVLEWYMNGVSVENDSGITPATVSTGFFETYTLNETLGNITANLTGAGMEGFDNATVSGASTNSLIIKSSFLSDTSYVGQLLTIDFEVEDENGKMIDGATCNAFSVDITGLPLQLGCSEIKTINGKGICSEVLDNQHIEGNPYVIKVRCSCGYGDNACFDEDGIEVNGSSGSNAIPFITNKWLTVNTLTDASEYYPQEEIFICANVTNIDYRERLAILLYHQVRCSSGEDNDYDLDRVLIISDDGVPDLRGISENTTQMQCKRFIIPEPKYLQGKSNVCYASTEVNVINKEREVIYSYYTSSPPFNISMHELNLEVDWIKINGNEFNTIINLSESDYNDYSGVGIGKIDIRLNSFDSYIRSYEQDYRVGIDFDTFITTSLIQNIVAKDLDGNNISYTLEFNDDGNLEIELDNVSMEPTGWYNVTMTFNNYEERQILALENQSVLLERQAQALEQAVGENRLNDLTNSDYFIEQNLLSDTIDESQLIRFNITILQEPVYGNNYKVRYDFYSRSGDGELVDSVESIIQDTGNHNIYFRSTNLNPDDASEIYLITSTVSMLNEYMIWEDFETTSVSYLTVNSYGIQENGVEVGKAGFYDIIVNTFEHKYLQDSIVVSNITILNTGDIPDEDTVLIYYLVSPNGDRYGEVKEQILEVPVGETVLQKEVALPVNTQLGEWRFYAEYYTVVQPTIIVYDTIEVVKLSEDLSTKISFLNKCETIYNNSIKYIKNKDHMHIVISGIIIILGIILLLVTLVYRRKN